MATYYVYGLMDPDEVDLAARPSITDLLAAVRYVGKGIGSRMEQHEADVRRLLETGGEVASVKQEWIARHLNEGKRVPTLKLMAGFEREEDAYRAEAFAIDAIDALRRDRGREPLTNAVKGHGVAAERLESYLARMDVDEVVHDFDCGEPGILVKGSAEDLDDGQYVAVDDPDPDLPGLDTGRVREMRFSHELPVRPGWDPHNPWPDELARERARRFWPIAGYRVEEWLADPDSAPRHLFLAIKDGTLTVVRFVWRIDPNGTWEAYPQDDGGYRWGVPLGERVTDHPLLNTVLRRRPKSNPEGSPVQALQGYSSGILVGRF